MYILIVVLLGLSLAAGGQDARMDAPWLTVYDPAGRPRWEVQLGTLSRDADGWHGSDARILLYYEGEAELELWVGKLLADPLGREWELKEGVEGAWGELKLQAERAHWDGRLTLWEVGAHAQQMSMVAAQAEWSPGGVVELSQGHVEVGGWKMSFGSGEFDAYEEMLTATDIEMSGHGLRIVAGGIRVPSRGEEVELSDAELRPGD